MDIIEQANIKYGTSTAANKSQKDTAKDQHHSYTHNNEKENVINIIQETKNQKNGKLVEGYKIEKDENKHSNYTNIKNKSTKSFNIALDFQSKVHKKSSKSFNGKYSYRKGKDLHSTQNTFLVRLKTDAKTKYLAQHFLSKSKVLSSEKLTELEQLYSKMNLEQTSVSKTDMDVQKNLQLTNQFNQINQVDQISKVNSEEQIISEKETDSIKLSGVKVDNPGTEFDQKESNQLKNETENKMESYNEMYLNNSSRVKEASSNKLNLEKRSSIFERKTSDNTKLEFETNKISTSNPLKPSEIPSNDDSTIAIVKNKSKRLLISLISVSVVSAIATTSMVGVTAGYFGSNSNITAINSTTNSLLTSHLFLTSVITIINSLNTKPTVTVTTTTTTTITSTTTTTTTATPLRSSLYDLFSRNNFITYGKSIGTYTFNNPVSVSCMTVSTNNTYYIVDQGSNKVVVLNYDLTLNTTVATTSNWGECNKNTKEVYITDPIIDISKMTSSLVVTANVGGCATCGFSGMFHNSLTNRLYVTEVNNKRVRYYSTNTSSLTLISSFSTGSCTPYSVFEYNNLLYIGCDNTILITYKNGTISNNIPSICPSAKTIYCLSIDDYGYLAVPCLNDKTVQLYNTTSSNGVYSITYLSSLSGFGNQVNCAFYDNYGRFFVTDKSPTITVYT